MSYDLFLLFIKIILSSLLLFLRLNTELLSLHFLNLFVSYVFLSFIIDTDPFELLNFIFNFIHLDFWWTKLINFSVWHRWVEDIINLSPFVTFSSINNNKCLSWTICSCGTSWSMNVSITVQWNSILHNVCNKEIQSSCCHICWYQNIYRLWFLKSLKFRETHFLLHMRMKIRCLES